jgi:hypothetical protein
MTAPLGARLGDVVSFTGAVSDTDGAAQYRIVHGDRLLWCSGGSSLPVGSARVARRVQRQIRTLYPALGHVEIADVFGGVIGMTVHGMPQVGAMRRGVWVASGFGRQGLNTSAMAGQMIARGIVHGDDRWRLFSPFELVWAGGAGGKVVGQAIMSVSRGRAALAGMLARYRERALLRERVDEARIAAAGRPRGPVSVRPPLGSVTGTPSRETDPSARKITDIDAGALPGPPPDGSGHGGPPA